MSDDEIGSLVHLLLRVRGIVAAEAPSSPAWAATVEWRDELEAQLRARGMDPDALARMRGPEVSPRERHTPPPATWANRSPAGVS